MNLKVCGITNLDQLVDIDRLGVQFGGFIFYDQSPRFVDEKFSPEDLRKLDLKIKKVGVFVNATEEEIMEKVETYGLDMVQLHGDETPGFCKTISSQVTVIKVFRINAYNEQNIDWMVKPYEEYCDYYLFDTNRKQEYGGTGEKFDWNLLLENKINKPFFLSGGIGLSDLEKLKTFSHPFFFCVDINSRVELQPGIKDLGAVHQMADEVFSY
ncbi:MAG: phosphoribosylanthranilate isomerase [Bacteroidota bacterium]|nr:phosphoribosylanthranilate isomerase [Bacteroidota bacterium]